MSSSSYCHGLQSCLEPGCLVEPRVLWLKLAPPKSNVARSSTSRKPSVVSDSDYDTKVDNIGDWSFLQCLANKTSQTVANETTEKGKFYTPPTFKLSSTLSEKSLAMCTESLGSETGSEMGESIGHPAALVSLENGNYGTHGRLKLRETRRENLNRSVSFPPPLTSLSCSTNLQLRPRRNEGHLVLEAVAVSPSHVSLLAERINGRLRLHLVKDDVSPCNSDNKLEDQKEAEEEIEEETCGEKVFEEVAALEMEAEHDADDDYDVEGEDLHENNGIVGGQIMGKLARPSKCKEGGSGSGNGNNELLNWEELFWVAT